jgi:radical SAM protein with 4Fe4S-binding SPASM domain
VTNIILFIKYFTFLRLFNLFKVFTSYYLSVLLKKPVVWGMPPAVSVEPVNLCNLKCPECPTGTGQLSRKTGRMSFEKFKKIADEVHRETFYFQLFFQGEPFLNKDIFKMTAYAREKKIYTSISTNAQLLDEAAVDKILESPPDKLIFSIDGIDEESYSAYRTGGSFKKADYAFRLLAEKRKEQKLKLPIIEFQIIIMKHNEFMLKDSYRYAKDCGADRVVFKTMQINSNEGSLNFLPENPLYSRYKVINGSLVPKNKLHNRCKALYKSAVITWDGRVVPCCFDKDADYTMGILNGRSFKEIWYSEAYSKFRRQILTDRKSLPMCINCSEGNQSEISARNIL